MGRIFFDSIQNNVHRTLIGGLTFIAIKGVLKIYFKQKQFVRKKQRKILDFTEDNLKKFSPREANTAAPSNRSARNIQVDHDILF